MNPKDAVTPPEDSREDAVTPAGQQADSQVPKAAESPAAAPGEEDATAALQAELADVKNKYLRSLADMDNLRKRCRRDMEEARINGRVSVLEELLPVFDSMDMALKAVSPDSACQAVYDGMVMVQKQFMASMEKFGLKRVVCVGEPFDPTVHEAVSYVPSDAETGTIIEEMRAGYVLGDRLLRAAMVVVSAGPSQAQESDAPEAGDSGSEGEPETESESGADPEAVPNNQEDESTSEER